MFFGGLWLDSLSGQADDSIQVLLAGRCMLLRQLSGRRAPGGGANVLHGHPFTCGLGGCFMPRFLLLAPRCSSLGCWATVRKLI